MACFLEQNFNHVSSLWQNFWILNPLFLTCKEGCVHAELRCWAHATSTNVLHSWLFLHIKNIYSTHVPAAASRHGLIDWRRQLCMDTKYFVWSVWGLFADIVCRCELGFIQNSLFQPFITTIANKIWFTRYTHVHVHTLVMGFQVIN